MHKKFLCVLLLILIFFIFGCTNNTIEEKEPIKIAINSQWPGYAHTYIAQEKGFFEKNNVGVELIATKDDVESRQLYTNKKVDGYFNVYVDIIIADSEGVKSKVVYVADFSDTGDVIIGKPEFNSLADLRGEKIGIEGINTFSHIFALSSVEKEGLSESDVQFEQVFARDVLTALEQGKIDAGHTWEPTKSAALEKGYKILGKAGDVPGIITDVLAFDPLIIDERPEDIQAIVTSILEARDFVHSDREEALGIMATKEGMSKQEMHEGIKGVIQPDVNGNIEAMKKSEETTSLYGSGKIIADFYLARGQLSQVPNFDEIIEPRFVNNIR